MLLVTRGVKWAMVRTSDVSMICASEICLGFLSVISRATYDYVGYGWTNKKVSDVSDWIF